MFNRGWCLHYKNITITKNKYLEDKLSNDALERWSEAVTKAKSYVDSKVVNHPKTQNRRKMLAADEIYIMLLQHELNRMQQAMNKAISGDIHNGLEEVNKTASYKKK